jgi:hypothetical protein
VDRAYHGDLRGNGWQDAAGQHELYPSRDALDLAIAGMEGGMLGSFAQLNELLATFGASVGGP